tara:strand:+ start:476 stop:925 length:450 start_codon:yes stop_codon:yes gene_type:complete
MATTTATVSISSSDLIPGSNISINGSSTLMKTGLTTGLDVLEIGKNTLAVAGDGSSDHLALFEGGVHADEQDQAAYLYMCNNATDPTYYIEVTLHDTVIGRLYAGDWMFMPYSQGDNVAELNLEAEGGTQTYEYALFATAKMLLESNQA